MFCCIKIVVIVGFVCSSEEMLELLIKVGVNVFWFNFLYGFVDGYCIVVK